MNLLKMTAHHYRVLPEPSGLKLKVLVIGKKIEDVLFLTLSFYFLICVLTAGVYKYAFHKAGFNYNEHRFDRRDVHAGENFAHELAIKGYFSGNGKQRHEKKGRKARKRH